MKQHMNWSVGNAAVCLAHGSEEFEITDEELAAVLSEYTLGPGVDRQMAAEHIAQERTRKLPHVHAAFRRNDHSNYSIMG